MSEQRVLLDRADYYELATLAERMKAFEARAQALAREMAPTQARLKAHIKDLATRYQFTGDRFTRIEDDGCVLVLPAPEEPSNG